MLPPGKLSPGPGSSSWTLDLWKELGNHIAWKETSLKGHCNELFPLYKAPSRENWQEDRFWCLLCLCHGVSVHEWGQPLLFKFLSLSIYIFPLGLSKEIGFPQEGHMLCDSPENPGDGVTILYNRQRQLPPVPVASPCEPSHWQLRDSPFHVAKATEEAVCPGWETRIPWSHVALRLCLIEGIYFMSDSLPSLSADSSFNPAKTTVLLITVS